MGDVVELDQTSSMMKEGRTPVLYVGDKVLVRMDSFKGEATVVALDVPNAHGQKMVEFQASTGLRLLAYYHEVSRV